MILGIYVGFRLGRELGMLGFQVVGVQVSDGLRAWGFSFETLLLPRTLQVLYCRADDIHARFLTTYRRHGQDVGMVFNPWFSISLFSPASPADVLGGQSKINLD